MDWKKRIRNLMKEHGNRNFQLIAVSPTKQNPDEYVLLLINQKQSEYANGNRAVWIYNGIKSAFVKVYYDMIDQEAQEMFRSYAMEGINYNPEDETTVG